MADETVQRLLDEYLEKEAAAKEARVALKQAALNAFFLKAGDTVRVHLTKGFFTNQTTVEKIGIVKIVEFSISMWDKTPKIELKPVVLPLKKDGTMAQIGEICIWKDTKVELVSRPE